MSLLSTEPWGLHAYEAGPACSQGSLEMTELCLTLSHAHFSTEPLWGLTAPGASVPWTTLL